MAEHSHHHGPHRPHPSATVGTSILRLSAWERLTGVAIVLALLWSAILWALG